MCQDFEVGREEAVQKDCRQREQRAWREGAGNREEEQMVLGACGSGLVAGSGQLGVQGKGWQAFLRSQRVESRRRAQGGLLEARSRSGSRWGDVGGAALGGAGGAWVGRAELGVSVGDRA